MHEGCCQLVSARGGPLRRLGCLGHGAKFVSHEFKEFLAKDRAQVEGILKDVGLVQ